MKHYNIPIFVPHLGCPHNCVFCDQKKITGYKDVQDTEKIRKTIDDYLLSINKHDGEKFIEIGFFGGSFTAIDVNEQKKLCSIAKEYLDKNLINAYRCSTRPDAINDEILSMLEDYSITTIELGVQSTDDAVLSASERGHTRYDVFKAAELIKKHNINLGLQMMVGLPLDTKEKSIKTCEDIISLNPYCVRIYPTLTLRGTKLYSMYKNGEYTPPSLDECIDTVAVILDKFIQNGINVIRIGLQTTDEINANTVIGPYHQCMRELCESRIFRNKIEKSINTINSKNITIYSNPKNISKIIGNQKSNVVFFKEKYGINITIKSDNTVLDDNYNIKINKI